MTPTPKPVKRQPLLQLARVVRNGLEKSVNDPLLALHPAGALKTEVTDTYGWYVSLGSVIGSRGELQIWFDHSTRVVGGPQLSACFMVKSDTEKIRTIAKAGIGALGKAPILRDHQWEVTSGGESQMRARLPKSMYGRPLAELYEEQHSWKFYTMYWADPIERSGKPNQKLISEVTEFLADVIRAVTGVMAKDVDKPYPGFKNRTQVAQHIKRERCAALAKKARIRDKFTCTVCHVNFTALYGKLGSGFAEVHHRVPLASKHAPKVTQVSDLVTVCANCHRMLHRMKGKVNDLNRLQKLFTGQWPEA